jgi:hypothetical protein
MPVRHSGVRSQESGGRQLLTPGSSLDQRVLLYAAPPQNALRNRKQKAQEDEVPLLITEDGDESESISSRSAGGY